MKIIEYRSMFRFSPDKMQKNEVYSTPNVQADIYCFESGQAQKAHKLSGSDKLYFVLEGSGRFTVGRTTREIKTGTSVLAPAGEEHGVVNMGEEKLVCLVITSPPAVTKV